MALYHRLKADCIVAESNYGGEMVRETIKQIRGAEDVPVRLVTATRGKAVRAEPVAAKAEQGLDHHVGSFPRLEDELCIWTPGDAKSPNRLDADVWASAALLENRIGGLVEVDNPFD